MRIKKSLILASLVLTVSACETVPTGSPESQWFKLPPGSTVTLNQDLQIPARKSEVYLVNGAQAAKTARFEPYCYFQVYRTRDEIKQAGVINADTFEIKSIYRRKDYASAGNLMLASSTFGPGIDVAGNFIKANYVGGASEQYYMNTHMKLESATQPDVTTLICGRFGNPVDVNYVNLVTVEQMLGTIASINPSQ